MKSIIIMKHSGYRNLFGFYSLLVATTMRLFAALIAIVIIPLSVKAQNVDPSLLRDARRGDPLAMAKVAIAYDESAYSNEAFTWAKKSAEKGSSKGCALVAYHKYLGAGTDMSRKEAMGWALRSIKAGNDGLGFWLMHLLLKENEVDSRKYLDESYQSGYPVALLYYSRLYATGSKEFGIPKDELKSKDLLEKAARYDLTLAKALIDLEDFASGIIDENTVNKISKACDLGIPVAMSYLATMYSQGVGVEKDMDAAFRLYESAAAKGDSFGIEGLADCYRIGMGVGQDQAKAIELYSKIKDLSPRAKYLLACYKNEGLGGIKDEENALKLLQESALDGYVYSQALLGVALFAGTPPVSSKNTAAAFSLLKETLDNKDFKTLQPDLKAKVLEYASSCYRYGFGVEIDDYAADKLYKQSRELNLGFSLSRPPFGLVDALSVDYLSSVMPSSANLQEDDIINLITLNYPDGVERQLVEQKTDSEAGYSNPESQVDSIVISDTSLKKSIYELLGKNENDMLSVEELSSVSSLSDLKIDNYLTTFNEFVFFKGIHVIPTMYFQGFSRLTSIALPDSITTIMDNAFLGCSSLTSIIIPDSVESIGDWAFANCEKLKSFYCFPLTPPNVGDNFLSHVEDVIIYVPKESFALYKNAPGWKTMSKRIRSFDHSY